MNPIFRPLEYFILKTNTILLCVRILENYITIRIEKQKKNISCPYIHMTWKKIGAYLLSIGKEKSMHNGLLK